MFGEGFFWLIRGVLNDFLVILEQLDLGLSTDLVLADDNGTDYDIYRLTSNSKIIVKPLKLPPLLSKRSRYNLQGYTLRGSLVVNIFVFIVKEILYKIYMNWSLGTNLLLYLMFYFPLFPYIKQNISLCKSNYK